VIEYARKHYIVISVFALLAFVALFFVYGNGKEVIEEIDQDIEAWQMEQLASIQRREGIQIKPFASDGCSGGLSDGWSAFINNFPRYEEVIGMKPPWESCCVEHDRTYWQGDTQDGYHRRLQADQTLRECVLAQGREQRSVYAREFSVSKKKVDEVYKIISDVMYHTVRLGGKPCSRLPWRWGYGWPHCYIQ
jgi:hypothetical protein